MEALALWFTSETLKQRDWAVQKLSSVHCWLVDEIANLWFGIMNSMLVEGLMMSFKLAKCDPTIDV